MTAQDVQSSPTPYIVSPVYDWLLFLLPPVLALALGIAIADTPLTKQAIDLPLFGNVTAAGIAIAVFIHAHLVIVFFRSHGNEGIAQLYPFRFLVAPILLYTTMVWSMWAIITVSVISTMWDVYHSGLQTFGFSRIYDRKVGNHPAAGRRLDWWLNHLLYAGPILAGATMMDHAEEFNAFHEVGATFFTAIPAYMEGNQRYFTWAVLALGSAFLAYYLFAQWRFHRQGHQVSWLKVYLLTSTGLTSIYTWGFNSFGEAFFIMNFFHSLQYFGIVWATEKRNMMRMFRVENLRLGKPITLLVFLGVAVAYGCFVEWMDTSLQWLWAATIVVSIMHFWYDGFIWSVSKRQV